MFDASSELTRLVFLVLAGLVLLCGSAADLFLGVLFQSRRLPQPGAACPSLGQRPFTLAHVAVAVLFSLFFALPVLFQKPGAPTPKESALLLGPLLYALAAVSVVSLCLAHTRVSFRKAFGLRRGGARDALAKGALYGIAAVPPVMLLSMAMGAATKALGYEPQVQEVFDWLSDSTLALSTRVFMMVAAVVFAPVAEELIFRGILFSALLRGRAFAFAALLSSAYFALVHFHAPSFLPLLALSFAFSAGYAATGSILTPIVMHMLFNLTSVLCYLAGPAGA